MMWSRLVGRGVLVVALLLALASAVAHAQTAPAGNAHPQTQGVSEAGKGKVNPFGDPVSNASALQTVQAKAEFAAKLNLDPLRDLAVFHNGRAKILDTLARETVETITGRKRLKLPSEPLQNLAKDGASSYGSTIKPGTIVGVQFEPLFTLLDITIDPRFYIEQPLVGVGYLPLREELLELAFPSKENPANERVREAFMRTGRVTPRMVDRLGRIVRETHAGERQYIEAINRTEHHLVMFVDAKANLEMVAPTERTQNWLHLSDLPETHPVRLASAELGAAWRAGDVARANAAIASLASELPKVNAEIYPTTRRAVELAYNDLRAFEWGWVLYCVSLVALLLAFGTQRSWLAWAGGVLLAAGTLTHATGFVLRSIVAERYTIQNQFESMTGISLFAVLVAFGIMLKKRQWLFGAAAAAVGFMTLVTATQTAIPGEYVEREAAILNTSVLLKYHVTTVLVSYALIALGFVISLFYLGAHYFNRSRGVGMSFGGSADASEGAESENAVPVNAVLMPAGGGGEAPKTVYKAMDDLDRSQMIVLQLAFWTLGVGILLGAWWADHSWGRWWAFDPKETWALVTWIVYLIVIHVRKAAPRTKGLTTAWLSVIGFVIMLWTYFGVNLLLPGLHAYA
jgi:cytochrome c-type biogenesis protein CcsB